MAAIDVGLFTELDAYRARIDALIDAVRALPAADGTEAVRVPGEPEERIRAQRAAHGIPLPLDTAANLREVAGRLGVAVPAELAA